jgi:muconolactone D-isomerase
VVEFLVQITTVLPPGMPAAERDELVAAERRRGQELVDEGVITAIWRVPGGLKNVGIWEAADATELHDFITSLPAYPWFSAHVTPLAIHPLGRVHRPWTRGKGASNSDKRRR